MKKLKDIKSRIKEALHDSKFKNVSALAEDAGVNVVFIYDILSGRSKHPSAIRLAALASSLNVSLDWLVTGKEFGDE